MRDEVKILLSVDGMTDTRALDPATGGGTLDADETFALVVRPADGVNKRFDYTVGATKLYWDQMPAITGGKPDEYYDFLAVYPNVPEFGPDALTFNFNAATADNPDLLIANANNVGKNATVQLTFRHAMHKLVVNLTSNYFEADDLAAATVKPVLKSTVRVDPVNGAIPEYAGGNTDSYAARTGASTSWIVAPQNLGTGAAMLSIRVGDYLMEYRVPASLTALKGGEVTTLTLALDRDAVTLEGDDVSQWGTETEVPGTIPVTE